MTQIQEKILAWVLRAGIVLALFSHVYVGTASIFPFITPRAAFFQTVTEILFAIAVILVLFAPGCRLKWTPVSKAVCLFLAASVIAIFNSADISKSFIGTFERSFGLFHIFHYGMLFFAARVAFQSLKQWRLLFGFSICIALFVTADFVIPLLQSGSRSSSIMGNTTFLGAYLLLHTFFTVYFITQSKNRWKQVFLGLITLIFMGGILASGVRGAFVGLAASVLYLFAYAAWKLPKWRWHMAGAVLILLLSYTLIFVNKNAEPLRGNPVVQRITNFSAKDETIRARFAMWSMAWEGFKERPILGWGRENYSLVFNKHFDPAFDKAGVGEGWEDRTHNVFFDELINGGIVELLAYLIMLAAIFMTIRSNPVWTAMLIAYVVQAMFGVEGPNSYIPLFLFMAFADFLAHPREHHEHQVKHIKPLIAYAASTLTALAMAVILVFFTLQPILGNQTMFKSYIALATNQPYDFSANYEKGKNLLKYFPSLKLEAFGILGTMLTQNAQSLASANLYKLFAEKIIPDYDAIYKRRPWEQRWTIIYAQVLMQTAALTGNPALWDKTEGIAADMLNSSPDRKLFQFFVLRLKEIKAQIASAAAAAQGKK